MTDKELLELAAKAAGMQIFVWGKKGYENYCIKNNDGTPGNRWNPLTDDGDAFRLAVKLNMSICRPVDGDSLPHYGTYAISHCQKIDLKELDKGDPLAATRRAITRAAAEIGKTLDK